MACRVGRLRGGATQSRKMVPEQTGCGARMFCISEKLVSAPLARALLQLGATRFTLGASKSDKHAGHLTKVSATNSLRPRSRSPMRTSTINASTVHTELN